MDPAPPRIRSDRLARALAESDQACHVCGHSLRGLQEVFCPECGTVVAAPVAVRGPAPRAPTPAWVRWWRRGNSIAAGLLLAVALARLSSASASPLGRAVSGGLVAAAVLACAALVLHLGSGVRRVLRLRPAGRPAEILLGLLGSGLAVAAALALR